GLPGLGPWGPTLPRARAGRKTPRPGAPTRRGLLYRMGLLDSKQQSAAAIVLLLGVAIVIALSPYVTGLVGVPVLYAVFVPVQQWLARRMREQLAALLVVALALFLIVVPGVSFAGLLVGPAAPRSLPCSSRNDENLRQRCRDVTTSTIIGTGLTAAVQGLLVGVGFWIVHLPNAVFWGVVTMVFAVLPVVGSGLVWGPGAIALLLDHRPGPAVLLALIGLVVVGNVDYLVRPMVFRRWAHIHPLVTLVGALAGVPYFGLLGLLIGPLALSYLFELIKMYREEYLS